MIQGIEEEWDRKENIITRLLTNSDHVVEDRRI